ncbi:Protein GrpE [Lentibacillus sp. JNUCC-1]|uniref:nucleotide exchange factor GrpE n=1 Tax=Lentibacillus sp. JNUCC-1 TaxID=2654513 RepID=UPI0012E74FC9|nr:nucleotide exchange factor GrpE [Lentibacillus sp. JNUCC-1]MUV39585.1 Protein GrpE [Lentibacillus sp. JNUCC-1]
MESEHTNATEKNESVEKDSEILEAEEVEQNEVEDEQVEALKSELVSLKNEKDQLQERLLRVQAEFDNFKKRSQKEKEAERMYKSQDLAQEILPVLDNFNRALAVETNEENKSFLEGMNMINNQLVNALESAGVKGIDAVGEPFDPNLHHAVMQVEDDQYEANTVVEELQKGYMLKDRVIRPAMVKVNN